MDDNSTPFDKDRYWINFGDKICQLNKYYQDIHCDIISPSFGKSHSITKLFYSLTFIQIQGRLDSFVCSDYPINVHSIYIEGGRSITSVFYNASHMIKYEPKHTYTIQRPRLKMVYEEDLQFIHTFFNSYVSIMNEILNCSYLQTLSHTLNKRFIKLHEELTELCRDKLEIIHALRDVLPNQSPNTA